MTEASFPRETAVINSIEQVLLRYRNNSYVQGELLGRFHGEENYVKPQIMRIVHLKGFLLGSYCVASCHLLFP